MASFLSMPDELILAILYLVPSTDLAASVQLVSRRLNLLSSEPQLWRGRCLTDFCFWTDEHRAILVNGSSSSHPRAHNWRHMWLDRMRSDAQSLRHLDRAIQSKRNRIAHLNKICRRGLDAKDLLLAQYHLEDGEDILARRYYADKALSSIHRSLAIEEWWQARSAADPFSHLDRALAAFDMFVLYDGEHDMDAVQKELDRLAAAFRQAHPRFDADTTRQKALALAQWVRAHNLVGLANGMRGFRNLRNCLLGQALFDPEHPSLPIVSSALYTCLAQRLGMAGFCCAVPGHVYCGVMAPMGETVDGTPLPGPPPPLSSPSFSVGESLAVQVPDNDDRLFLDPFHHAEEVSLQSMRQIVERVSSWSVDRNMRDSFLLPSDTAAIVVRVGININATWNRAHEPVAVLGAGSVAASAAAFTELRRLARGDADTNLASLRYAAMWAEVLLRPLSTTVLESLMSRFAASYSEDSWIVERYLVRLFDEYCERQEQLYARNRRQETHGEDGQSQDQAWNKRDYDRCDPSVMLRMVWNLDQRQPEVMRRYTQEICEKVRFRVGQVFKHARLGYVAIIMGWQLGRLDVYGGEQAYPSFLGLYRHSSRSDTTGVFYSCIRDGTDESVVSQDSVVLVTSPDEIPEEIFHAAGRLFKRFDAATCSFVSNIREMYPDD